MKLVNTFRSKLPTLKNSLLAIFSAVLLIFAFPNFEIWFLASVALVPLFYAIEREKDSFVKTFILGWLFGTIFFFGSCWWLAYPMYTYAGFPVPLAYLFVLLAFLLVGLFPAIFAGFLSILLKRFGIFAIFAAPFLWATTEFLRFHLTGNNWNAIAYSQAFVGSEITRQASIGGIYLVGFSVVWANVWGLLILKAKSLISQLLKREPNFFRKTVTVKQQGYFVLFFIVCFLLNVGFGLVETNKSFPSLPIDSVGDNIFVVAIQPNVPMNGLKTEDWERLRARHVQLAENVLNNPDFAGYANNQLKTHSVSENTTEQQQREFYKNFALENFKKAKKLVIFPESPMNFEYTRDRDFQNFIKDFVARNNTSVLFNAAEPAADDGILNSAVLVNERGTKIAQYDKIHLVPFGEFVPLPDFVAQYIPTVAGNFEFGKSYDLMPLGDLKFGTMICFESHFPTLSRQFALEGADALIEMTNDGYLGDTGVLRQHLASAIFRAVETNRPVLRVTNVGITAYINERGEVLDATKAYTEDTRIWTISKSDGAQTFYVKYGDWFAWLCATVSLFLLAFSFWKNCRRKLLAMKVKKD